MSAIELLPGGLYALGGLVELDGSITWAPSDARGYQPVNGYLALEPDQATVIDTGLAMHSELVRAQLAERCPAPGQVTIALTRAEYDCMGNLGPVIEAMPVADLYTGGTNNPFDGPDDPGSPHGRWNRLFKLRTIPLETPIPVGQSRRLEVWSAPLRVLPTHWLHDSATGCLFTSDLFSHTVLEDPAASRVISSISPFWRSDDAAQVVKGHLLAKFNWLPMAAGTTTFVESLDAVFGRYDVRMIAPTHGCILVGAEVVAHHHRLVRRALIDIGEVSARRCSTIVSGGPREVAAPAPAPPPVASAGQAGKLPRQIDANVFWLGTCIPRFTFDIAGERFHGHLSSYLVVGPKQSVMIDTGLPSTWADIEAQLDEALAGRRLDWIFPTHAEPPHSSSVGKLLARYPDAKVIGDVRDYHLFFPGSKSRLVPVAVGDRLDLGGGYALEFAPAFFKDLTGTLWAYERRQGVLFVSDGFGIGHREPVASDEAGDVPLHRRGECTSTLSEIRQPLHLDQLHYPTVGALNWIQFADSGPIFDELDAFLRDHPANVIAPAHGYVIDGPSMVEAVLPLLREAHGMAFRS